MNDIKTTIDPKDDFGTLFKQSIQQKAKFKPGEVVSGTILKIDEHSVLVDIGFKSEATVPIEEFYDLSHHLIVKAGDHVNLYLEELEDEHGQLKLSKEKADKMKIWDDIAVKFENGEIIQGRIMDKVKGGLSVDIGIKAFLPGSQIDLSPVRNMDGLLGKVMDFKVIKFNKKTGNIVLSRRVLLEKARETLKLETLKQLDEGFILDGTVKNITEYGAFIDLGGIDGLLHITDMSWGRITHPSEILSFGQKIKVKVLKYDRDSERVSLGLKQLTENPWEKVANRYAVGNRVKGKVVNVVDYGIFLELEQGIEGLIHVSEISWSKKAKHPSKTFSAGDMVEAMILEVDVSNKRISLGIKQIEPNPWTLIAEKYPVGTHVKGTIKNITEFGIFVGIEEDVDGLVHISDISWTQKIKNPNELYKKGDEIETVVLSVDIENERFSLGIKQLTPDPWLQVPTKYPLGTKISGTVAKVVDFGIFVKVDEEIEGLIHISETTVEDKSKIKDLYVVGSPIEAIVLSADSKERRLSLSAKALETYKEAGSYEEYLKRSASVKAQLGDFIKPEDLEKVSQNSSDKDKQEPVVGVDSTSHKE